jgi:RNA polymerase-binding transcription factor DksA
MATDTFTPLDAETLAHFQQRLLEERKRALRELGRLGEVFGASQTEADGDLTNYPFHMADQGTDTMEQEKNYLLASQEGRLVWHVDEALRRLYRAPETFGRCESCGRAIAHERLDALPHARYCIDCKQREEGAG